MTLKLNRQWCSYTSQKVFFQCHYSLKGTKLVTSAILKLRFSGTGARLRSALGVIQELSTILS